MQHSTTNAFLANGDIEGLIEFHRQTFGGFVMEEEIVTPAEEVVAGQVPVEPVVEQVVKPEEPVVEKPKLTYEELEAELGKVRSEAADRRVRAKALEDKLTNAKSPEEVEEILGKERETTQAETRKLTVENVALKFELPDALRDVLKGETREELEAHAKVLSEFAPAGDPEGNPRGGLDPNNNEGGFDPVKTAREARATRY